MLDFTGSVSGQYPHTRLVVTPSRARASPRITDQPVTPKDRFRSLAVPLLRSGSRTPLSAPHDAALQNPPARYSAAGPRAHAESAREGKRGGWGGEPQDPETARSDKMGSLVED